MTLLREYALFSNMSNNKPNKNFIPSLLYLERSMFTNYKVIIWKKNRH